MASTSGKGQCGLWMYSFEELAAEGPLTPIHIATYLFPPLLPNALAMTSLARSQGENYNGKTDRRPFTTAKGASIFIANFSCHIGPSSAMTTTIHRMFIHPFAFDSLAISHLGVSGSLPKAIPWASWGPNSTRILDYVAVETCLGYNVGCEGNQLNFNTLDIARDLHRIRSPSQGPQELSSHPQKFFGRHSPTIIPANGIFQEDVTTYLPYRSWDVQIPGCQIIASEDWIHFVA